MAKKKVIGLSILLLVFLLGLSTVSFAVSPSKVKNMINTCMVKAGFDETKRETEIASIDNEWLSNYNYDNIGIICYKEVSPYNSGSYYLVFINLSETISKHPYRYNYSSTLWRINNIYQVGQIIISGYPTITSRYQYSTTTNVNGNFFINKTSGLLYTDVDIYSASNGGTVVYSSGYGYPTEFTPNGPYTDAHGWGLIGVPDSQPVTVSGITFDNIPIYLSEFDSIYSPYNTWSGGWLGGADELDEIVVRVWRYGVYANRWYLTSRVYRGDYTAPDVSDNSTWCYFDLSYGNSDSIVIATVKNKIDSSKNYNLGFYLKSDRTVINDNVVDITGTIAKYNYSGENSYANNNDDLASVENLDNAVNDLTSNDKVAGMTNELLSGDVNDIANKFGYTSYNNTYGDFITTMFQNIGTAITGEGDVYFDIPLHTGTIRIWASDFYVPESAIKQFVRLGLVFFTIMCFFQYLNTIIVAFNQGNPKQALDVIDVDIDIFKM